MKYLLGKDALLSEAHESSRHGEDEDGQTPEDVKRFVDAAQSDRHPRKKEGAKPTQPLQRDVKTVHSTCSFLTALAQAPAVQTTPQQSGQASCEASTCWG